MSGILNNTWTKRKTLQYTFIFNINSKIKEIQFQFILSPFFPFLVFEIILVYTEGLLMGKLVMCCLNREIRVNSKLLFEVTRIQITLVIHKNPPSKELVELRALIS